MRFLIVGIGNIGQRHLSNLRSIEPSSDITVLRQRLESGKAADVLQQADRVIYNIDDALDSKFDMAIVANPSYLHIETALKLAHNNIHLFIEKPLSNTLDNINDLLNLCRQRDLVLTVGYNFRFYRPLQVLREALMEGKIGRPLLLFAEAGQYLPDWIPGYDYRKVSSGKNKMGGGVVLELSHELDYARWLFGEINAVSAQIGRLSDLEIDVEDFANIAVRFTNQTAGNIHLNMIQRVATRSCRIVGIDGTLVWDGMSHCVKLYSVKTNAWTDIYPERVIDRNEMYIEELRHFLQCVRKGAEPVISAEDGKRIVEIATAVKRSSSEGRIVEV